MAAEAGRAGALAVTVASNSDAAELNQAVRAARAAAVQVDDTAVAAGMDGARIGAGDRVVTRCNDTAAGVANREPWTVSAVNENGSVVVRAKDRHVRLPTEYVASAVQLGYASTDYGNQGMTADRSVTWLCEAEATEAAGAAQQAEEHMARRDARRAEALAHNEASAAKSLELEASDARGHLCRLMTTRLSLRFPRVVSVSDPV